MASSTTSTTAPAAAATSDAASAISLAVFPAIDIDASQLNIFAGRGDARRVERLLTVHTTAAYLAANTLTPLHCAAETGKKSMCRRLVDAGFPLDAVHQDKTPLMLAATAGKKAVVVFLASLDSPLPEKSVWSTYPDGVKMALRSVNEARDPTAKVQRIIEDKQKAHKKTLDDLIKRQHKAKEAEERAHGARQHAAYMAQLASELAVTEQSTHDRLLPVRKTAVKQRKQLLLAIATLQSHLANSDEQASPATQACYDGAVQAAFSSGLVELMPSEWSQLRAIAKGAFGQVLAGTCSGIGDPGQEVAIKVFVDGTEAAARTEALTMSRLDHPNVIKFLALVRPKDTEPVSFCIAMPFISGGTVLSAIDNRTLPREWQKVRVVGEAACGLAYLHSLPPHSVIHCDIKPANMLLDANGNVVLCDVGLTNAGVVPNAVTRTAAAGVKDRSVGGTLPYKAPEVLNGDHERGRKIDIYSLGMVLWQLFSGREPWRDVPADDELKAAVRAGRRPPEEHVPDFLRPLLRQMWAQQREDRPYAPEVLKRLSLAASARAKQLRDAGLRGDHDGEEAEQLTLLAERFNQDSLNRSPVASRDDDDEDGGDDGAGDGGDVDGDVDENDDDADDGAYEGADVDDDDDIDDFDEHSAGTVGDRERRTDGDTDSGAIKRARIESEAEQHE